MTNELECLTQIHHLSLYNADRMSQVLLEDEKPLKLSFALENYLKKIYTRLGMDFLLVTTMVDEIPYACIYFFDHYNNIGLQAVSLTSLESEKVEIAILMDIAIGKVEGHLLQQSLLLPSTPRLD